MENSVSHFLNQSLFAIRFSFRAILCIWYRAKEFPLCVDKMCRLPSLRTLFSHELTWLSQHPTPTLPFDLAAISFALGFHRNIWRILSVFFFSCKAKNCRACQRHSFTRDKMWFGLPHAVFLPPILFLVRIFPGLGWSLPSWVTNAQCVFGCVCVCF